MKVGEYVRYKRPFDRKETIMIGKILRIYEPDEKYKIKGYDLDTSDVISDEFFIKSSPNIIDLIEVGDVIKLEYNGVEYICDVCEYMGNENCLVVYCEDAIIPVKTTDESVELKSIVTHEQFSQNEYRIGE